MIVINNTTSDIPSGGLLIGSIVLWYGSASAVPSGYAVCNGSGGTIDLRNKMVMCANNAGDLLTTGGSATHLHSGGDSDGAGAHDHSGGASINASGTYNYLGSGATTYAAGTHNHSITSFNVDGTSDHSHGSSGVSGLQSSMPVHKKLYWIKRLL